MAFDTHCHLNDEKFDDVDEVITNLKANNVSHAVIIGCDVESSIEAIELAEKADNLYAVVGFHPENLNEMQEIDMDAIKKLASHKKVVALGEMGLDYHWEPYDKEKQKRYFIEQIELAKELNLPIVVHQRDCGMDMLEIIKAHGKGVKDIILHCFSESVEMAKEYIKLGCYISFAGTLTFKNARNLLDVAKIVPENLLLTETDSPYLTPHPFRGKRNEPKYVNYVVEKLAELKGKTKQEMETIIEQNAKKVFNIQ